MTREDAGAESMVATIALWSAVCSAEVPVDISRAPIRTRAAPDPHKP
mgnify:CR=1 FL=1